MLILPVTIMDKNIKGLILLALVLLWRKFLNIKAGKQASCLLWGLLILYLLCPYAIFIKRDPAQLSGLTASIFSWEMSSGTTCAILQPASFGIILSGF